MGPMGPMPPMGPMGDRWPAAGVPDALWFVVLLVALLAVMVAPLVLAARRQGHANDSTERQRPDAVLRDRYARRDRLASVPRGPREPTQGSLHPG